MSDTDITEFFTDLDGGVFAEKLAAALSEVAGNVVTHGKAGKVQISLDLAQLGSGSQVMIKHTLTYKRPTMRGWSAEEDVRQTPMHVNPGGKITLFAENQGLLFDKQGTPTSQKEE